MWSDNEVKVAAVADDGLVAVLVEDVVSHGRIPETAFWNFDRQKFGFPYEAGLPASLVVKPTFHSRERERRLIFEPRGDLREPRMTVEERELLDFVEVIDE